MAERDWRGQRIDQGMIYPNAMSLRKVKKAVVLVLRLRLLTRISLCPPPHLCPVDSMFLISIGHISASSAIVSRRIPVVFWTEMADSPKVGDGGPLEMLAGSVIKVFFDSSSCQNKAGWQALEMTMMAETMATRGLVAGTMTIPMTGSKYRAMFLTRKTMKTNISAVSHDCFAASNEEGGGADRRRYHVYMPPHFDGAGTIGITPLPTRPRFTL